MGASISSLFDKILGRKKARILLLGLDCAGKTTLLYQFKLGESVAAVPTTGFSVETVKYKNISFVMWDISGGGRVINFWNKFYENTQGIIFVIDSSDKYRIETAKLEMHKMLSEEILKRVPLLVFANKQDLGVMNVEEVTKNLELQNVKERDWNVVGTCATKGEGLYEGLEWLCNALASNK